MDLTFVCWKWRSPFENNRDFKSHHVNVLRESVAEHYRRPHKFVCITDDSSGLRADIEAVPMPETGLENLRTLIKPISKGSRVVHFPSCFRRLWMFSNDAQQLGEWVFCLDIDVLIVGNLAPLVDKFPGDFVGWLRAVNPRRHQPALSGAVYKLRTGSHTEVWDDFDPLTSPRLALEAGYSGSDQAWISYKLLPSRSRMWLDSDGLGKPQLSGLTGRERILFTSGYMPPWSKAYQRKRPWVGDYWQTVGG